MPDLGASLASEEGRSIKEHFITYLRAEEGGGEEEADEERDSGGGSCHPQQRIAGLQQTLTRLKGLKAEGEEAKGEEGKEEVVNFLEDLLKICEES